MKLVVEKNIAERHNFTDALVLAWLKRVQKDINETYARDGQHYYERDGICWIANLSASVIADTLGVTVNVVHDSINRLSVAGLILTDRTGKYLTDEERIGFDEKHGRTILQYKHLGNSERKTWVHVQQTAVEGESWLVDTADVETLGGDVALATLLAVASSLSQSGIDTKSYNDGWSYTKLSAAQLATYFPATEKTIRKYLKSLVQAGRLLQSPKQLKYYALIPRREHINEPFSITPRNMLTKEDEINREEYESRMKLLKHCGFSKPVLPMKYAPSESLIIPEPKIKKQETVTVERREQLIALCNKTPEKPAHEPKRELSRLEKMQAINAQLVATEAPGQKQVVAHKLWKLGGTSNSASIVPKRMFED